MRPLALLILLTLGTLLRAGDTTEYTALVTGMVCQNCKATVTEAMKKLPGVREVHFKKGEKPGQQKISFAASSDKLSKKDAINALAEHASEFEIVSFSKGK